MYLNASGFLLVKAPALARGGRGGEEGGKGNRPKRTRKRERLNVIA